MLAILIFGIQICIYNDVNFNTYMWKALILLCHHAKHEFHRVHVKLRTKLCAECSVPKVNLLRISHFFETLD